MSFNPRSGAARWRHRGSESEHSRSLQSRGLNQLGPTRKVGPFAPVLGGGTVLQHPAEPVPKDQGLEEAQGALLASALGEESGADFPAT